MGRTFLWLIWTGCLLTMICYFFAWEGEFLTPAAALFITLVLFSFSKKQGFILFRKNPQARKSLIISRRRPLPVPWKIFRRPRARVVLKGGIGYLMRGGFIKGEFKARQRY